MESNLLILITVLLTIIIFLLTLFIWLMSATNSKVERAIEQMGRMDKRLVRLETKAGIFHDLPE
jgi:hypothetical protein